MAPTSSKTKRAATVPNRPKDLNALAEAIAPMKKKKKSRARNVKVQRRSPPS